MTRIISLEFVTLSSPTSDESLLSVRTWDRTPRCSPCSSQWLKCVQGSPLKVRISSRYDVQKSLSTSFMATSSILLNTLPGLANPNMYLLECAKWANKCFTCSTARFYSYCMIGSTSIKRGEHSSGSALQIVGDLLDIF